MSTITLEVSDDLAERIQRNMDRLPVILNEGLKQLEDDARSGYNGAAEILEFFSKLPSLEEILDLHASSAFQKRIDFLLEKNRETGLSPDEKEEWQRYSRVEHLVRMAKARAYGKLHPK